MGYEQAFADHAYLWAIGPAEDMTGGYVDQEDLARLLKSPTTATACRCLENQIRYWFEVGPDVRSSNSSGEGFADSDPELWEIAERYGASTDLLTGDPNHVG